MLARSLPARIHRPLSQLLNARYRGPKIRFGIVWKMFLTVLTACLVISLTMGYAVRVSFENGFLHYVRERDAVRTRTIMTRVISEYALHGNWSSLRDHPDAWLALLAAASRDAVREELDAGQVGKAAGWKTFPGSTSVQQLLGPLAGPSEGPHWGMRLPSTSPGASAVMDRSPTSSMARDESYYELPNISSQLGRVTRHSSAAPSAALFDAKYEPVANSATGLTSGNPMRAVVFNGKVVGWLSVDAPDTLSDAADIAFQAQQLRSTWQIAGVAVLLAALVALLLARIVLAPVKRVMNAIHSLAGGDYSARVPAARKDELGRLASDFNVLADSLERAERVRRDLIADISHELRTPLAILRSELEAVEDGVHEFNGATLKSLQAEVGVLNKLIEDLYELSLSDLGVLSYHKAPACVKELVLASLDSMRESFKAKWIAVEFASTPDLDDATFAVDSARFVQLVKNLLQNSLRYTDPGGDVIVSLAQNEQGWQLDVLDSTPDVPDAALSHLFDRFYRVDESRSRQSGGAGLGLSLCHAIVAAHGGSIDARHSPLGGVWITARFPFDGV